MRAVAIVQSRDETRALAAARRVCRAATTMPTPQRGMVCIAISEGTPAVADVAADIERAVRRELAPRLGAPARQGAPLQGRFVAPAALR